jgi:tetratricopeptide (TPR) repeat protein
MNGEALAELEAARQLVLARRPELAERELRRLLARHPELAHAHALLGWCLLDRGGEAVAAAQEAVRLEPEWPYTHIALAEVHLKLKQPRLAEQSARQALALEPGSAQHHATLAAALLNQRFRLRAREALRFAEAGLALDPADADCARLRALALLRRSRLDEARKAAAYALSLAPEDAAVHATAGFIEVTARQPARGRPHLREALRLDPERADAERGLRMAMENKRLAAMLAVLVGRWRWPVAGAMLLFVAETAAVLSRGEYATLRWLTVPVYLVVLLWIAVLWARLFHPGLVAELRQPGGMGRLERRDAIRTLVFGLGLALGIPLVLLLG